MALVLGPLPRQTQYTPRQISATNSLSPAFGVPVQRIARKGSRWGLDVSIPVISGKSCGPELLADLFQDTETVVLPFPEPGMPLRNYGSPKVSGAAQSGRFLSLKEVAPGIIKKGKFFSVVSGGQRFLYNVSEQATVTNTGLITLKIWPMMRRPLQNNDTVELAKPMIEGFVQTPPEWQAGPSSGMPVNFSVVERE